MNPQIALLLNKSLESLRNSNLDTAELYLQQALRLQSSNPHVHRLLGVIFAQRRQYPEALHHLNNSLKVLPKNSLTLSNLGNVLLELKEYSSAIDVYDKSIKIDPNYEEAWSNKGNALYELERYDEAIVHHDKALSLKPDYVEAWSNKGNVLHKLRRFDEAIVHYDKALEIEPDNISANWNKSLTLLHLGNFLEGWQLYEWRWRTKFFNKSYRNYSEPIWSGQESLADKTILVWSEQGLGDTIHFCRYIEKLVDLGAEVIFEVQEPLLSALEKLNGVSCIVKSGDVLPRFDFHVPLMSLPLSFKTTIDTIPSNIPYISVNSNKVAAWAEKLGDKDKFRVGLVWSGGYRPDQPEVWRFAQQKSIPLSFLAPLNIPSIQFYSLQKGAEAEGQLVKLESDGWSGPNIISFVDELKDFSDTAALIHNLDLVISVDTSVAHMAGAMGKPVWVMSQFLVDWRWMPNQQRLWYPSARVFSQPSIGDWEAVIAEIRSELLSMDAYKP